MIGLAGLVGRHMHLEDMLAAHLAVHHELHRERGAFTRLEGHRTDDRLRRSAPLHNLNDGHLCKAQWLVAGVAELEPSLHRSP